MSLKSSFKLKNNFVSLTLIVVFSVTFLFKLINVYNLIGKLTN